MIFIYRPDDVRAGWTSSYVANALSSHPSPRVTPLTLVVLVWMLFLVGSVVDGRRSLPALQTRRAGAQHLRGRRQHADGWRCAAGGAPCRAQAATMASLLHSRVHGLCAPHSHPRHRPPLRHPARPQAGLATRHVSTTPPAISGILYA